MCWFFKSVALCKESARDCLEECRMHAALKVPVISGLKARVVFKNHCVSRESLQMIFLRGLG